MRIANLAMPETGFIIHWYLMHCQGEKVVDKYISDLAPRPQTIPIRIIYTWHNATDGIGGLEGHFLI